MATNSVNVCRHVTDNQYCMKIPIQLLDRLMKRQLQCEHCNLTFKSKGFLSRHKKIVHGIEISEEKFSPRVKYQ